MRVMMEIVIEPGRWEDKDYRRSNFQFNTIEEKSWKHQRDGTKSDENISKYEKVNDLNDSVHILDE